MSLAASSSALFRFSPHLPTYLYRMLSSQYSLYVVLLYQTVPSSSIHAEKNRVLTTPATACHSFSSDLHHKTLSNNAVAALAVSDQEDATSLYLELHMRSYLNTENLKFGGAPSTKHCFHCSSLVSRMVPATFWATSSTRQVKRVLMRLKRASQAWALYLVMDPMGPCF